VLGLESGQELGCVAVFFEVEDVVLAIAAGAEVARVQAQFLEIGEVDSSQPWPGSE
jgi:hypothetical protein